MSDTINHVQNLVDTLAKEAVTREWEVSSHDGEHVSLLVAPRDVQATDVQAIADKYAAVPRFRAGRLQAFDVSSFAALVLRDYDRGSMIFADVSGDGVAFEACLDYHEPITAPRAGARDGQRHGREVLTYAPELSPEWVAWSERDGQEMTQGAFAQWIDDHLTDIADPRHLLDDPNCTAVKIAQVHRRTAADLYGYADPVALADVSRGLEIREGATLKSAVKLESGEVSFTYTTEHTGVDGQPLKVPSRFLLSISVFEREDVYLVPVKLSYRKSGGSIVWMFDLIKPDVFVRDAIEGMVRSLRVALTPAGHAIQLPGSDAPPVIAPVVPVHMAKRAGV